MAVNISLHPSVLMNISDHYTRSFAADSSKPRIFGILVGTIVNRNIHIQNSFESLCEFENGTYRLDLEFIQRRLSMVLEIFPNYEFLGWYSTGKMMKKDIDLHKSLVEFSENLLYLNFDTTLSTSEEILPVDIYETHVSVSENVTTHEFRKLSYSIETTDAERISIDFVSEKSAGTGDSSQYSSSISNFLSAVRLFKKRLTLLLGIVENNPKVRGDRKIMRKINEIAHRIPVNSAYGIEREFNKEIGEELLVILTTVLTKSTYHLTELVDKFHYMNNDRIEI